MSGTHTINYSEDGTLSVFENFQQAIIQFLSSYAWNWNGSTASHAPIVGFLQKYSFLFENIPTDYDFSGALSDFADLEARTNAIIAGQNFVSINGTQDYVQAYGLDYVGDDRSIFRKINADFAIARDYRNYLENTEAINQLISAAPNSKLAAGWIATLAAAEAVGLNDPYHRTGDANDNMFLTADGDDVISGGDGNDRIMSYGGDDQLDGGSGDDILIAGNGEDTLVGGAGADRLDGGRDDDLLQGGDGDDLYVFGEGYGRDVVEDAPGGSGDAVLLVGSVDPTQLKLRLVGQDLEIAIVTADQQGAPFDDLRDRLTLTDWQDLSKRVELLRLDSGTLIDLAQLVSHFALVPDGPEVNLATQSAAIDGLSLVNAFDPGNVRDDTYDVYKAMGQVSFDYTEHANGGTDTVRFTDLNLSDITFSTWHYTAANPANPAAPALRFDWDDGTDSGTFRIAEMGQHVERFEFADGSAISYALIRPDGRYELKGAPDASGNSFVSGTALDDFLYGGAGDDLLRGGQGADRHVGGAGTDIASYADATAGVTVNLLNGSLNTGFAAGDTYVDMEVFEGSDFDDMLMGDADANTLLGGAGNDIIAGGAGDDWLNGGAGNDTYEINVGAGYDTITDQDGLNRILFGADLSIHSLDFVRTQNDLFALSADGTVQTRIVGFFTPEVSFELEFVDGAVAIPNEDGSIKVFGGEGDNSITVLDSAVPPTPVEEVDIISSYGDQVRAYESYRYTGDVSDMIDGDPGTRSFTHSAGGWSEIDLGGVFDLSKVVVQNSASDLNYLKGTQVVLLDADRAEVHRFDAIEADFYSSRHHFNLDDAPARARFIRFESNTYITIAEVQAFGTEVAGSDLPEHWRGVVDLTALYRDSVSALQSSTFYNSATYAAHEVVDGSLAHDSYNHTNYGADQWVEVDLGGVFDLSLIRLHNINTVGAGSVNRLNGAEVAVLDGDRNEVHRFAPIAGAEVGEVLDFALTGFTGARYVRVEKAAADYLHINELQVFGLHPDAIEGVGLRSPADEIAARSLTIEAGDGDDEVVGGEGNDTISGGSDVDIISGRAGNDRISGDGENDILNGGSGADTFVFRTGDGMDVVEDFSSNDGDLVEFDVAGVSSFAELQAFMSESGGHTIIEFSIGEGVQLSNVELASLQTDDFRFV